ncbi:inactive receptor [Vigna angularis]|uniref:Inactive receptor n=1 Tax=Phaseolus angularis TaxID=3914 RepID=A0A8T0LBZ9_PHAAN|nr:inactive receptor [Vigna angularis]
MGKSRSFEKTEDCKVLWTLRGLLSDRSCFFCCASSSSFSSAVAVVAVLAGNKEEVNGSEAAKKLVFFGNATRAFDLEDLLRASAEVLGKGTFGTTYKVVLEARPVVAVMRWCGDFPSKFDPTSSALQELLRKLGVGLDDLLPSSAMAICGRKERIV